MTKSCTKCGVTNSDTAKFCKGCGNSLPAEMPPVSIKDVSRRCAECNTDNTLAAKFCKKCGALLVKSDSPSTIPSEINRAKMAASDEELEISRSTGSASATPSLIATPPDQGSPASVTGNSRVRLFVSIGVLGLTIAASGGGYYWYQQEQQRKANEIARLQMEEKARQAEVRRKAELEDARRRAHEAKRRAAQLADEQARAAVRLRAENEASRAKQLAASPEAKCKAENNNFISRALCQASECRKAAFANSTYCQNLRRSN